jgi:hypothetical protein
MLSFVDMRASRVSPRRATYFLLLRQEKVSKEKATLLSATLRFATGNLRCSVQPGSRSNSPAAQTIASPDPSGLPLLGADRRGGEKDQQPDSLTPQVRAMARTCFGIWYPFFCLSRPGWAEQRRRRRDQGRSCLSAASSADPRRSRAAQVARSVAQGPRLRVAFLLLTFLWRSKEQVSRPPGRDPACSHRHPSSRPLQPC